MSARTDDDEAIVHPSEAVVLCLLQCNEIYCNLMDSETTKFMLQEMGKTVRALTKCLGKIAVLSETTSDAASFTEYLEGEDEDE